MATIVFTLTDVAEGQISLTTAVDRSNDTPDIAEFPATPAMIVGLTFFDLFNSGALEKEFGGVVDKIMANAKLTPEQMEEAKKRAEIACRAQS